ncbi:hypothetical protein, partial [Ideonella sp.]|uniref:hypothetical protein n=1 Tax=Ideonella sp. TaxID=1929293 RepID=UPI003BB595B0
YQSARRANSTPAPSAHVARGAQPRRPAAQAPAADPRPIKGRILTQHTGLPPRETGSPARPKASAPARRTGPGVKLKTSNRR